MVRWQLYLLQLEGYELGRYLRLVVKQGVLPKTSRQALVITKKARGLLLVGFALHILISMLCARVSPALSLLVFIFSPLWYFAYFSVAVLLLRPLEFFIKQHTVASAAAMLRLQPEVRVVGISGSYGKTTMKSVLSAVLAEKYSVAATPESYNVPLSVARWLKKVLSTKPEVLVVEMGEHYEGDVAEMCRLTPPNVAVITGINEAHLERFGTLDVAAKTIFEICDGATSDATLVLSESSGEVARRGSLLSGEKAVRWFGSTSGTGYAVASNEFDSGKLCNVLTFEIEGARFEHISVQLLGGYAVEVCVAAAQVALTLGLSIEQITAGLSKVTPVEHRLQPIRGAGDVLVIDDSYNGNPDGVREAIELLRKFTTRRKVYLTPGLVEAGSHAQSVHRAIGEQLASVADLVLLVKNSVTPFIASGLTASGFPESKIVWYPSAVEAHADLKNMLRPGDVIIFQNDWGDQYT